MKDFLVQGFLAAWMIIFLIAWLVSVIVCLINDNPIIYLLDKKEKSRRPMLVE